MRRVGLLGIALVVGFSTPACTSALSPIAPKHTMENSPAALTHAVIASLSRNGEPAVEWMIADAPVLSGAIVGRLAALPKPVRCAWTVAAGRPRVECGPLPEADRGQAARNAGAGSLIARLVADVGEDGIVLVEGDGFSMRLRGAELVRWAGEYVLHPPADLFRRHPTADEAASGTGAVVGIHLPRGEFGRGVEFSRR